MLASQHGEGSQESMMSRDNVRYVGNPSRPINIPNKNFVLNTVVSISEADVEDEVYDITVEDAHEFFANGILVHNCIDAIRYSCSNLIKGRNDTWAGLIS